MAARALSFSHTLCVALLLFLAGAALAACATSQSQAAVPPASPVHVQQCGTITLNPRGHLIDAGRAQKIEDCFWRAYQHCRAAALVINAGGVDTLTRRTFTIGKQAQDCTVSDTVQHSIVPHPFGAAKIYACSNVTNSAGRLRFVGCGADGTVEIPASR